MLSGPVALKGARSFINLWTPLVVTTMLSIAGACGSLIVGLLSVGGENTDENWWLKIFALILGLFCKLPSESLRKVFEILSFFWDLMYDQKSLLLLLPGVVVSQSLSKYDDFAFLHSCLHFCLISRYLSFTFLELGFFFSFSNHLYFCLLNFFALSVNHGCFGGNAFF